MGRIAQPKFLTDVSAAAICILLTRYEILTASAYLH